MKRVPKPVLLISLGLLLGIMVAEIALRLAGVSFPVFGQMDEHRGFAGAPGVRGWQTQEGRAFVAINSDGLRDREHKRAKPAGVYRIAVLGDSFAQALQVDVDETFWRILERDLNACEAAGPSLVETINFGVSGYGTAQELLTLRHQVWKYDPDLVLLAIQSGSDLGDNTREIRRNSTVPYFLLQDGKLWLDDSFRDRVFRLKLALGYDRLITRLNTLRVVQVLRRTSQQLSSSSVSRDGAAANTRSQADRPFRDGFHDAVYAPPRSDAWHKAWKVTEALIAQMAREVSEGRADFRIVLLTNGIQVHPDREVKAVFQRHLGITDLHYPTRRFQDIADRLGVPFIDLVEPLAAHATAYGVYLHGFPGSEGRGHWNVEGHRLAGLEIARQICGTLNRRRPSD